MDGHYILNAAGEPIPEPDIMAWALWFGTADRQVARTELPDDILVSTVFLGLDHSFGAGLPLLYETMVFGGPRDGDQMRYATRTEALDGHAYHVEYAQEEPAP